MSLKEMTLIDSELFESLVTAGANNLKANKKEINDLNVFPIPDGDTGDNMYMTYAGGISLMKSLTEGGVGEKADALARGMLLSARGNSGVILSQFFAGLAKGLSGVDTLDIKGFISALSFAVKEAYSSVVTPVEGTVLTVAREGYEHLETHKDSYLSLGCLFSDCVKAMRKSLDSTPELLPVLMEAGVVDSGGAGLLSVFEGMEKIILGEDIGMSDDEPVASGAALDFSKFDEDSVMVYGYCTELLLRLQNSKVDVTAFDVNTVIDYLKTVGDSLAVFKTGSIVKVHVHTLTPYKVLEFCQKFGEFLTVKIENMTLQHSENESSLPKKAKRRPKRERRKFGVVAVGVGEGIVETFTELGADIVIDGGQGNNPSIEDFIEAFEDVNADDIFVLPNNSNIIMAAKQAAEMYKDSKAHVIETKNFGEAYSILSMLDYSSDSVDAICEEMTENMKGSVTGMITSSIRSVVLDGVDVREGEYIGFTNKTMLVSKEDKIDALSALLDKLSASEREFIILFYGKDVTDEEKEKVKLLIEGQYPTVELYDTYGGQDVYDFIVILE